MDKNETLIHGLKREKRGLSLVWIAPIVAVLITTGMIWKKQMDIGTRITITITNGEGIIDGKTPVMYKGINIGYVEDIHIKEDDISKLELTALIDKEAADSVTRKGNKFWKVEPKVSLTEVSGLSTLISGVYIAVMPALKEVSELKRLPFEDHFIALDSTPVDVFNFGLLLIINTQNKGDMSVGAPVLYNKIAIGKVAEKELSEDKKSINLYLHIDSKYSELIHKESIFYKANALEIEASSSGVKVHVESLASLVAGGISIYNTPESLNSSLVKHKARFHLYDSYEETLLSEDEIVLTMKEHHGLEAKRSKLFYKGVEAGIVDKLEHDPIHNKTKAKLRIHKDFRKLANEKAYFWVVKPELSIDRVEGLDAILKGSYINFVSSDEDAKAKTNFVLHHKKPQPKALRVNVLTNNVDSIKEGTGVFYHGIKIGSVGSYVLDKNMKVFRLTLLIQPKYAKLVNATSIFYNNSGFDFSATLEKVEFNTGSIESLLRGGIAVDTLDLHAEDGLKKEYVLYSSRDAATSAYIDVDLVSDDLYGLGLGSLLRYKELTVGRVENIRLTGNTFALDLKIKTDYRDLIKKDTLFWVEKFKLGLDGIKNVSSAFKGAQVHLKPGISNEDGNNFSLMSHPPIAHLHEKGLRVVLESLKLGGIKVNTPVSFRQIKIGSVTQYRLNDTATAVDIEIFIEPCYAHIIRGNSYFYNASGIGMEIDLLGAKVKTETLESIVTGGISVLTPDNFTGRAKESQLFILNEDVDADALKWAPELISENIMCE